MANHQKLKRRTRNYFDRKGGLYYRGIGLRGYVPFNLKRKELTPQQEAIALHRRLLHFYGLPSTAMFWPISFFPGSGYKELREGEFSVQLTFEDATD